MKSTKPNSLRSCAVGLSLALTMVGPLLVSAETAGSPVKTETSRANQTELTKEEIQSALAQIAAELDHLGQLESAAPSSAQKSEIKARYAALKEQRDELKNDFNRARYEAFKADLQVEKERVSSWTRDKAFSQPAANSAVMATGKSVREAADKVADYRNTATSLHKTEAKIALAQLDGDIDLLGEKIDTVATPERKAELKLQLKALKDRRSELNNEFRKARYDALVDDVKAEWEKVLQTP